MKNFPLTCCYAPAFRSATRNEAAYAPQQVSGPTHAQPTTITSRSFLQNLTHITSRSPPRRTETAEGNQPAKLSSYHLLQSSPIRGYINFDTAKVGGRASRSSLP